jgi:hypothetical protein
LNVLVEHAGLQRFKEQGFPLEAGIINAIAMIAHLEEVNSNSVGAHLQ